MMSHPLFRNALIAAAAAFIALTMWMVFAWVPTETNQGAIQRALYVHVPIAWVSMVAIVAVAFFSVFYLVTGRERWDRLGAATAETGVVFGALMLITGIVWARPVWGVWWTGEAKLTTALILFFVYVAYLMFRAYFPPGTQRRRLAAVIALIGAIDAADNLLGSEPVGRSPPASDRRAGARLRFGALSRYRANPVGRRNRIHLVVRCHFGRRYRIRRAEDDVTRCAAPCKRPERTPGEASHHHLRGLSRRWSRPVSSQRPRMPKICSPA